MSLRSTRETRGEKNIPGGEFFLPSFLLSRSLFLFQHAHLPSHLSSSPRRPSTPSLTSQSQGRSHAIPHVPSTPSPLNATSPRHTLIPHRHLFSLPLTTSAAHQCTCHPSPLSPLCLPFLALPCLKSSPSIHLLSSSSVLAILPSFSFPSPSFS